MKSRIVAVAALAFFAAASVAQAKCTNCGEVLEVKAVEVKGDASGGGAVIGGVLGGVLGHQIGSGRGNTAATVIGAGAGAYAGHQVEKNKNAVTKYHVIVNMEEGKDRTFVFSNPPKFKAGDKVKVVEGKLQFAKAPPAANQAPAKLAN